MFDEYISIDGRLILLPDQYREENGEFHVTYTRALCYLMRWGAKAECKLHTFNIEQGVQSNEPLVWDTAKDVLRRADEQREEADGPAEDRA